MRPTTGIGGGVWIEASSADTIWTGKKTRHTVPTRTAATPAAGREPLKIKRNSPMIVEAGVQFAFQLLREAIASTPLNAVVAECPLLRTGVRFRDG
ncbi:MAG TPA: hypothetical protein VKT49_09170 [Bryobacteraceae bacterium]|nr:hypothetical protein [Bryobacteraceae bacterium]